MVPADFFNYLVYLSLVYDESIWLKSFTRISKFDLSLIFEKCIVATTRDSKKTVFCLFKIQKKYSPCSFCAIDSQKFWLSIAEPAGAACFFLNFNELKTACSGCP